MDLNKILKIVIIFAVLIITGSIFYHFVIYIPSKDKAELEIQEKKFKACEQNCILRESREGKDYALCLADCREKYAQPLPDLPKLK